jgi:hypothetical protein
MSLDNLNYNTGKTPAYTVGGIIARQSVDASDGQKLLDRRQLADPAFFARVKDILFGGDIVVVDVASQALTWNGKTVDGNSPEGIARVAELQAAWQSSIENSPRLGFTIEQVAPTNDPPVMGNLLPRGPYIGDV